MATYTELFDLAEANTLIDKVSVAITIAADTINNEPADVEIESASVANPTVITATGHGLSTGDKITIEGETTATPALNGTYTVTVSDANSFTIPVNVTVAGSDGTFSIFNHTNRITWAKMAFEDPKAIAKSFWYAMLAANKGNSVAVISAASDSAIQNNVDAVVNVFAGS